MNIKIILILIPVLSIFSRVDCQSTLKINTNQWITYSTPVKTKIILTNSNKESIILLCDTNKTNDLEFDKLLLKKGNYEIMISYYNNDLSDSAKYDFDVNLKEKEIRIETSLNEKYVDLSVAKKKTYRPYFSSFVSIQNYFNSPEGIKISPIKAEDDSYYKPPYFVINNYTNDTIHGEYFSGYLWGTLYYYTSDSTTKKFPGTIDMNFASQLPLLPDSSKIATVGSFGGNKGIAEFFPYKYELNFTINEYISNGYSESHKSNNATWYLRERDLFQIEYYKK